MKNILIAESKGNIGKEIILELFKKKHKIFIVTQNKDKSFSDLPIPVERIEVDATYFRLSHSIIKDIDIVLNLSLIDSKPTQLDILFSKNLVESFPKKQVKFVHISSSDVYQKSLDKVSESSPISVDAKTKSYIEIENIFLKVNGLIIRPGLIISSSNKELKNFIFYTRFYLGSSICRLTEFSWIDLNDLISSLENLFINEVRFNYLNLFANSTNAKDLFRIIAKITQRRVSSLGFKTIKNFFNIANQLSSKEVENSKIECRDLMTSLSHHFCYLKSPTLTNNSFHYEYNKVQFIEKDIVSIFDFFKDAKNLGAITPKKLKFTITSQSTKEIQEGTEFTYRLQLNGIPFSWTTHIENWNPPYQFTDYQFKGPYKVWYHTHTFYEFENGTLMIDNVKYKLPLGFIGDVFGLGFVVQNIKEIFNYRYSVIKDLLK